MSAIALKLLSACYMQPIDELALCWRGPQQREGVRHRWVKRAFSSVAAISSRTCFVLDGAEMPC